MIIKTFANAYYEGTKSLEGDLYKLRIYWNVYNQTWIMDFSGVTDTSIIINGLALLPGNNLFRIFGYNKKLGELWVIDNSGGSENPNFEDMGTRWELNYIPIADLVT